MGTDCDFDGRGDGSGGEDWRVTGQWLVSDGPAWPAIRRYVRIIHSNLVPRSNLCLIIYLVIKLEVKKTASLLPTLS